MHNNIKLTKTRESIQIFKNPKKIITKKYNGKGFRANQEKARYSNVFTPYESYYEQPSSFGGLMVLLKCSDLVKLNEIFMDAAILFSDNIDKKFITRKQYSDLTLSKSYSVRFI